MPTLSKAACRYRRNKAAHRSDFVEQVAEIVVVVALAGELVAMFGNVISRSLFDTSLLWSLEIGELALVVMTFIGGAIAYPRNEHMALHAFIDRLPQRWHAPIAAFALLAGIRDGDRRRLARLGDDAVALGRADAVSRHQRDLVRSADDCRDGAAGLLRGQRALSLSRRGWPLSPFL